MTLAEMARCIDHTLLKPEATSAHIDTLCDEAIEHGFAGVCINPVYVPRARHRLERACVGRGESASPAVVSVVGFPLGADRPQTKLDEARRAIGDGAGEIDMVIHVGALIDGDRIAIRREIEALAAIVHQSDPPGLLKVILETAALTDEQIVLGCRLCAEGEADFVKTSTGLHPRGGATQRHVRLIHQRAAPLRVKASGGIRTAAAAIAMLEAGAARIGTSSGVGIINELRNQMV